MAITSRKCHKMTKNIKKNLKMTKYIKEYKEISKCQRGRSVVRHAVLVRCVHASLYEGLSVRESIRPLVRTLVGNAFFLIAEIDKKQHGIIGKVETLFLNCNILQKTS